MDCRSSVELHTLIPRAKAGVLALLENCFVQQEEYRGGTA